MRLTLLVACCAGMVVTAGSCIADAMTPQPQYRGSAPTGPNAANYQFFKSRVVSALDGCRQSPAGFIQPQIISATRPNPANYYPESARIAGLQALLHIGFLVDALGNRRFLHVTHAFPSEPDPIFVAASLQLIRDTAMTPASLNGHPVSFWTVTPVKFIIEDTGGPMGSLLRQDRWIQMLNSANTGDVQSIIDSAYVAALVSGETGLDREGELSLLVDSALHGADYARMAVFRTLSSCSQASLVDSWVFADANAGSVYAEMTWADMLVEIDESAYGDKIATLLHKVAGGADPFYRLWAAGLLATAPPSAIRDPELALQVANALNALPGVGHHDDPDYAEVLAAAQAANDQFDSAQQTQRTAIRWAQHMGWDVTAMQARLTTYEARQPWHGYLCDCQRVDPGQN